MRRAVKGDQKAIRDLIHKSGINPFGLDWRRFVVALNEDGKLAACGQIKPHGRNVFELASIAVRSEFQGKGCARLIIEHLRDTHPGRLYLTCRSSLRPFYAKFGFAAADDKDLPPYFRRLRLAVKWLRRLRPGSEDLAIMMNDKG